MLDDNNLENKDNIANNANLATYLCLDLAPSFTYASYQNAVPIIRSLSIKNVSNRIFQSCRIELTSQPHFFRPKIWSTSQLLPGEDLVLSDRKLDFDADYLSGLNEAVRGEITIRLFGDDELLEEKQFSVRLLARDEWGGVEDMAQLLPAFVTPNDPAIATILRAAADKLAMSNYPSAMDGYQSKNPQRVYMLSAAIYSAIVQMGLHYVQAPASFEQRGQKIRRPHQIKEQGLATCLDTSLLFASALEAAGLNPIILLFKGHAAAGVWLNERVFFHAITGDQMELRKAFAANELILFETTCVTQRPAIPMEAAQQALQYRLEEEEEANFHVIIDIACSRSNGIKPLASHQANRHNDVGRDIGDTIDLPLPIPPNYIAFSQDHSEEKPDTAVGRIDRWQKKLLDLTLRNRLLNFPDTKRTIPFLCDDLAALEDRIAKGKKIHLIPTPEQNILKERDKDLYRDMHGEELLKDYASEALKRDELAAPLGMKELTTRLIELNRQVRNDFAEGGANTLFLAIGFLHWKKNPQDKRSYRAPLLLIPVKLERRSANSFFNLVLHGDEPRFNITLIEFLERDFDLKLPQFKNELPVDEAGIDVQNLLTKMRFAIRHIPGMEVIDEAALSTFSFAKFLMWKDLVERTDSLRGNRVVRHLIDTPAQAFQSSSDAKPFKQETDLDKTYAPEDVVCLLPADSSQMVATVAAAEGQDFIIIGPPGTGKSQTITNIIANCLANGKTVLFVAEKTAALDVVYRRLRENGLEDHCIELHSNKADRLHFISQLKSSWEHGGKNTSDEWLTVNQRLQMRRDELNSYVEALHQPYSNGWTVYQALGISLKSTEEMAPIFSWTERDSHDIATMQELEQLCNELALAYNSVTIKDELLLVDHGEWSLNWQEQICVAAHTLHQLLVPMLNAYQDFLKSLSLKPLEQLHLAEIDGLIQLTNALKHCKGYDAQITFDNDLSLCDEALLKLEQSIENFNQTKNRLAASYDLSAISKMDIDAIDRQWREANASFWPLSFFGRRKVQKILQSYCTDGKSLPQQDLPLLRQMKDCLKAVEENLLAKKPLPFEELKSDTNAIRHVLELAHNLRNALKIPLRDNVQLQPMYQNIQSSLINAISFEFIYDASIRFLSTTEKFKAAYDAFKLLARPKSEDHFNLSIEKLNQQLTKLIQSKNFLRDWSSLCAVKHRAITFKLTSLIELIENGTIEPKNASHAFKLGYARWWLPKVIDSNPVLRNFRRFQHENAIQDFREIDDLVRAHAHQRVIHAIAHGLPEVQTVPRKSELGLLRHQMGLQRPSQTIRNMIKQMPQSFPKLAPCMLMSPLSIAQYLPPEQALFDVVIFDEASQITTWDAVGAIARAKQTIIVGDPKQLPPTNFFGRNDNEQDADSILDHEKDLESILDEVKAAGIPLRSLKWHYRSRSESLIAFSNHHYYQNRLVTFPSPTVEDKAVQLRKIPNGIYDRGKSRTNKIEAEAVVHDAIKMMRRWLKLPEHERLTLGVITFNTQQQSLIQDLFDAACRDEPELEWFFSDDRIEPTIVKNLENVQGDERDVILFSVTFWKDAAGKTTMDFGALNREGGERRLNVAITRARRELIMFSGFTSEHIDTSRTKALAVHHLKTFLDYAERGAIALPATDKGSVGGFDSPFEEAVAEQLQQRGWSVIPQVGISGFRIDLGIKHPDFAAAYLAGVECDGASYHSAATAKDRDKIREQVLRGLGWNILRVWSTDWWFDASACTERLHASLLELLEQSRASRLDQSAEDIEKAH